MLQYATAIFLGAFLLFQVQPMVGKYILPWFGGTPAVWTTCMLFFQLLLLGGYLYAHGLVQMRSQRRQVTVHLLLLGATLLVLPFTLRVRLTPVGGENPILAILLVLAANVGLPYFVLSATSPLLQAWFGLARPGVVPYRLYALSNLGSLLALLSYPFVVEPTLSLHTQAAVWAGGFVLFAAVCGYCAFQTRTLPAPTAPAPPGNAPATDPGQASPGWAVTGLWLLLPACGSTILLAATNQMCWDVAVVPLLWILPLALYLLTFIVCFENERWYRRLLFWPLLLAAVGAMLWLWSEGVDAAIWKQVLGFSGGVFVCCMVCHGELARLKPAPRYLTRFYLMVAAGGALGGVFVTLLAPRLFPTFLELHLAIWCCCALALAVVWREWKPLRRRVPIWKYALALTLSIGSLTALAEVLSREARDGLGNNLFLRRNFYGVLRVREYSADGPEDHYLSLQHGRINHGLQFVSAQRRRMPTTYYGEKSGIGLVLRNYPHTSLLRVGVVGLGTGTIAAYGSTGDTYRFYDINPMVVSLATTVFHYLGDSQATCEIALGDARLSLEREQLPKFDVLALDAFTGDAIPVHLLTREAVALYLSRLKPGGVLAVHVSNRFLNLQPVVLAAAEDLQRPAAVIVSHVDDEDKKNKVYSSDWILVTDNRELLACQAIREATTPAKDVTRQRCLWTDNFSDLFRILRH